MSEAVVNKILPHESEPHVQVPDLALLPPKPGTLHEAVANLQAALQNVLALVDDEAVSSGTTWSSQKITEVIDGITGLAGAINPADGVMQINNTIAGTHNITESALSINPVVTGQVNVSGIWHVL